MLLTLTAIICETEKAYKTQPLSFESLARSDKDKRKCFNIVTRYSRILLKTESTSTF